MPASGSFRYVITNFDGSIGPKFYYAYTSASSARQGLYLSGVSGSPQLSLEPRSGSPSFLLPGDIWYESASAANGNMFIAEKSLAQGIVVAHRFLVAREDEITVDQVISRFTSSDRPTDLVVGLNAVVIDNFYVTVNSASLSGSLIRNATWNGGFFMPFTGTVAVSGSPMNFLVPSGSLIINSGSATIQSGTLSVFTGSILVRGAGSQLSSFIVSGTNVTASIQGNPIVSVLTGSVASQSLSPIPLDGTFYINTASRLISVRASGTYFDLDVDAPLLVDGGTY